jgi:hypothetical protein
MCYADAECAGFTWKHVNASGEGVAITTNCTGKAGQPCCYFQSSSEITGVIAGTKFDCWAKPGSASFTVTSTTTTPFPHFWQTGINSPHSAITLRADW